VSVFVSKEVPRTNAFDLAFAGCPSGQQAISGGGVDLQFDQSNAVVAGGALAASFPIVDDQTGSSVGWAVFGATPENTNATLQAFVVCSGGPSSAAAARGHQKDRVSRLLSRLAAKLSQRH